MNLPALKNYLLSMFGMSVEPYDPTDDLKFMNSLDDSIFYPKRKLYALDLNDLDIEELLDFLRWHIAQGEQRKKSSLIQVLQARLQQLARVQKNELLKQMSEVDRLLQRSI